MKPKQRHGEQASKIRIAPADLIRGDNGVGRAEGPCAGAVWVVPPGKSKWRSFRSFSEVQGRAREFVNFVIDSIGIDGPNDREITLRKPPIFR